MLSIEILQENVNQKHENKPCGRIGLPPRNRCPWSKCARRLPGCSIQAPAFGRPAAGPSQRGRQSHLGLTWKMKIINQPDQSISKKISPASQSTERIIGQTKFNQSINRSVNHKICQSIPVFLERFKWPWVTSWASRWKAVTKCPLLYCSGGRQSMTKNRQPEWRVAAATISSVVTGKHNDWGMVMWRRLVGDTGRVPNSEVQLAYKKMNRILFIETNRIFLTEWRRKVNWNSR